MPFKLERCMVYFKRGVETEIKYFNKIYFGFDLTVKPHSGSN